MGARESVVFQPLPGSDALKIAPDFNPNRPLPIRKIEWLTAQGEHRRLLENDAYDAYMMLDKVMVDEGGAGRLVDIGNELSLQELPDYLDAAGWAFAEAGLASRELSAVDKVGLIKRAEESWARALVNGFAIGQDLSGERQYEENEGHRIALNLAFVPLMKSIAVGHVREDVMHQTMRDVAEIARDSKESLARARERGDASSVAYHRGFMFETVGLMALLYIGDPRYVPFPSTARGGSGFYNAKQTHDISVVNQHWGDIRKLIPVEIKSFATKRARKRYRALIVSGRLRLAVGDTTESEEAVDAFYDLTQGEASTEDTAAIERLSTELREMLRLYQRGVDADGIAVKGLTRFHDSKFAAHAYPELSKDYTPPPELFR